MIVYCYDGTFFGFLTTIFKIYQLKKEPIDIVKDDKSRGVLGENFVVETNCKEAFRVLNGVKTKGGERVYYHLKILFLSEVDSYEMIGYRFIRSIFSGKNREKDCGNEDVRKLNSIVQRVLRERHRMLGFVRFEKVDDGFFFSTIQPIFNQIPLIGKEFIPRLRDEGFILYDRGRELAFVYEKKEYSIKKARIDGDIVLDKNEEIKKRYWKIFFEKIGIEERKNLALQQSKVPLMYRDDMLEFKEN